jgi:hypothetical protein
MTCTWCPAPGRIRVVTYEMVLCRWHMIVFYLGIDTEWHD